MRCAVFPAALALIATLQKSSAEPWWEQQAGQVKSVTGWLATDVAGKPMKLEMQTGDGATAFVAGARPIKLTTPAKIAANTEVTIHFTMNPVGKIGASLKAIIGEDGAPGLPVSVSAAGGSDLVSVNAAGVAASHQTRGSYKRSLTWPEDVRKMIEAEMASLPLGSTTSC